MRFRHRRPRGLRKSLGPGRHAFRGWVRFPCASANVLTRRRGRAGVVAAAAELVVGGRDSALVIGGQGVPLVP